MYKKLLKSLIVQGLVKLMEPVVSVRCLKRDVDLVRSVLSDAENEYRYECSD